ncbi:MAG: hypothetical protein ACK552_18435, partial [Microcystis sp.]
FVGIGSLINNGLPQKTRYARKIVIFGTGVGYGKGVPKIDESYTIYCVRGLLSAQALGISEKLAITDGAVLIRQVFSNQAPKKYRFSYMPHYELAGKGWETVCQKLGFGYIDPRWSVEQVLSSISETEILLAEALSTGQKIISSLAKMVPSFIWRDFRDYVPKVLPCKAFKDFVLY